MNANGWERRRKYYAYCAFAYFLFSAYMLFVPVPPVPQGIKGFDFVHFAAFFVQGFLVGLARRREQGVAFWAVALLCWGVGSEFLQPYTGRCFEWIDVAQDSAGALCGLAIATGALRIVASFSANRREANR